MENQESNIELIIERIEAYGKTSYELFMLKLMNATATLVTGLVAKLGFILVAFLCVLVLNVGVALWLGDCLPKIYYGFFIVGGFDLIIAIILYYFLEKWLKALVLEYIFKLGIK